MNCRSNVGRIGDKKLVDCSGWRFEWKGHQNRLVVNRPNVEVLYDDIRVSDQLISKLNVHLAKSPRIAYR
jgi:hypothetical protein